MAGGHRRATLDGVRRARSHRCRERLERLADSSLASEELRQEAATELARAIGFDLWCWGLGDPASLLPYGGVASIAPPESVVRLLPKLLALEQHDVTLARHEVALYRRPAYTLSEATGGELERSRRWAECLGPLGFGDLLVGACRDASGCWGWLEAYRASDTNPFADEDASLLAGLAPTFGAALRQRAASAGQLVDRRPPGVLILDRDLRATSWTATARQWIALLPGRRHTAAFLPSVVYAVAGRATAPPDRVGARLGAVARVHTRDNGWVVVEGEALEGAEAGNVAVTIRAADGEEALELLCRLHALTTREREIADLVVRGLPTSQIAERLVISEYTVKDHLKSIFGKTSVRGRAELAAWIYGAAPADGTALAS